MSDRKLPAFADRIKEVKDDFGSVIALANATGITRQVIYKYTGGDRVPDASVLVRISNAAGVSVDWLLGLSDTKFLPNHRPKYVEPDVKVNVKTIDTNDGLCVRLALTAKDEKHINSVIITEDKNKKEENKV